MGYPGAYPPVISVANCGWQPFLFVADVVDPTNPSDFWISEDSSWELAGQDLDVTAPGSWIVGPYQLQSGKISYYYLFGTSMASPHVAATAALLRSYGISDTNFVKMIIKETAKDIGASGYDTQSGWGILNTGQALYLAKYGVGWND